MNIDRSLEDDDEIDDVADGMAPDSRIIGIIDEMELAKDEFDSLDETEIHQKLVDMLFKNLLPEKK